MRSGTVYLLVMTSAFFWGSNFVLAAPILADVPPLWAAAVRFLLGATLMMALAITRREQLIALLRRHALTYLLLGAVGITAFNLLFFHAMQSTSADNAALIMATNPLLTTLLAGIFLRERPGARHLIALPAALAGVAIVITQGRLSMLGSLQIAHGDLLMLGADLSWAAFNVLGRRFMPQGAPLANTAWVMTMGAALLLGVAVYSGTPLQPLGWKAGSALLIMVLGGTVLAYWFWTIGIEHLGAARTAIFLNLVPVSAMLIAAMVGTLPTMAQLAGGVLVLSGVAVSMLPKRRAGLAKN